MSDASRTRDELARQADAARNRLARAISQLERRRHEALDLRLQLERHLRDIAIAGGLLLLAAAGAVGLVAHRIATAAQRRRRDRFRLARRVWMHPDRAIRAERRPFFVELGRAWLLSLLTAALARPARAGIAALVERGRARSPALLPPTATPALPAGSPPRAR